MKKILFVLLLALGLLAALPALAGIETFDKAPAETKIYEARTEKSITLLYGDARYTAGSIGMIYADRSEKDDLKLPLMVVFFTHDGTVKDGFLTITTDKKVYNVTGQSNLSKTGIAQNDNAFSVAVGPDTIAMFQDMVKSRSVTITLGPAKNRYEIILTAEKKALLKLTAWEYVKHVAPVYETMDRLDRKRFVERTAAQLQITNVKKSTPVYKTLTTKSTGAQVKKLQRYLIHYGYLKGEADGKYSKNVVAAVKKYQRKIKASPSGKADAKTQQKLYAKEIPWKPAVTLAGSRIRLFNGQKTVCFAFRNVDCEYTIASVDLVMRVLNEKNRPIAVGGMETFSFSVSRMGLKPGKTRSNGRDSASLINFPQAKCIQAGIVRYTLSGGTVVHVPTEKVQWVLIR